MSLGDRITTCHNCEFVQKPPYDGSCVCTIDNVDIIEHSVKNSCPKSLYALPQRKEKKICLSCTRSRVIQG